MWLESRHEVATLSQAVKTSVVPRRNLSIGIEQ